MREFFNERVGRKYKIQFFLNIWFLEIKFILKFGNIIYTIKRKTTLCQEN